jgi:hypothetical protein
LSEILSYHPHPDLSGIHSYHIPRHKNNSYSYHSLFFPASIQSPIQKYNKPFSPDGSSKKQQALK